MRYSDLFTQSLEKLKTVTSPDSASINIQILMEEVFNLSRTDFWIKKNQPISDHTLLKKFHRLLLRLQRNEPIAYILKKKEFYGEMFVVNKNVLIPRPETELLVEAAIPLAKNAHSVLDIGAGSGIISIILARHSNAEITAIDISSKALYVLRKNSRLHNVDNRIKAIQGDLFPKISKKFDIIVSNPPYIPFKEWQELEPGVKDFEPQLALTAGEDGLDIIRRIVEPIHLYLQPQGYLLMEFGFGQKEKLKTVLEENLLSIVQWIDDYSGIPRVVVCSLKEK